jgi:ParB/RepB/Spo0J family partition protein
MGQNVADTHDGVSKRAAYKIEPEKIVIRKAWNPRSELDKDGIESLAKSIATVGLIVPIVVRAEKGEIVLVDGERRLRAILLAKKKLGIPIKTIPVEFQGKNEGDAFIATVIANEHREDLSALDRAMGYKRLVDFGHETKEIADMLGLNPEHVTRTLRLLEAAPSVRKALKDGIVSPSVVSELVRRFPDDKAGQEKALADALTASGGAKAKGKHVRAATAKGKGKDASPRRRTRKHAVLVADIDEIEKGTVTSPPSGSYIDGYLDALKYAATLDERPEWLKS